MLWYACETFLTFYGHERCFWPYSVHVNQQWRCDKCQKVGCNVCIRGRASQVVEEDQPMAEVEEYPIIPSSYLYCCGAPVVREFVEKECLLPWLTGHDSIKYRCQKCNNIGCKECIKGRQHQ